MKTTLTIALCACIIGCTPPVPSSDAGVDAGLDSVVPYEVLDGGLYKFLDGRGRSCDDACGELGLDCQGAFHNGRRIQGLYDYGECQGPAECAKDWSGNGWCDGDLNKPPLPMQWMACGCLPFRDAGP